MEIYSEFPCKTRNELNKEADRIAKLISADINNHISRKHKLDFTNAVVYTIKSRDNIYVGSTTNFQLRKKQHGQKIIRGDENSKLYQQIKANKKEWDMKVYRNVVCTSSQELQKEEEKVRTLLKADLNSKRASCKVGNGPIVKTKPVPEPIQQPQLEKDKKKTIVQLTAKRYTYIGAVDDFEEEKAKHTDFVAQYKRGRLMYHNVICEWISLADFDWSIKVYSEFEFGSLTNTTDGYHDLPEVETELERIRLLLKKTGDYDYVDTRAQQLIYREQEWTLLPDPVGWAAKVEDLEELPKKFFHRRLMKFYNFNGTKVFWSSRHIRCVHHGVKHKICRHCLLDPETDKKAYLRDIDYYELVERGRYRKGG